MAGVGGGGGGANTGPVGGARVRGVGAGLSEIGVLRERGKKVWDAELEDCSGSVPNSTVEFVDDGGR